MREFKYRKIQPKQVVVEDEAVPYEGPYEVTSNGTLQTAGKTMGSDLTVTVQPNLTVLTATENKTYTPTAPVQGFSSVTVNVPVGGNTLKTLLDARQSATYLFFEYKGDAVADLIQPNDTSEVTSMNYMFQNCYDLTSVPLLNTSKVTNMQRMFSGSYRLTSIPALDASQVTNFSNTFAGCTSLTEIKMTGMRVSFNISASTLFTREALVEIITNCATVDTTRTLTMGATNLAKLTQDDIDLATSKGWTVQ